jgi:hypothetical protein
VVPKIPGFVILFIFFILSKAGSRGDAAISNLLPALPSLLYALFCTLGD